ncbi:MAG: UDP-N-acetylmuramoyl-L-alanine--D-glutamate ligase [Gammaproteobacteria bacterium]|jgi:UDP-N-acetylmuramoylalanine--D-glutamate ligase|nr:UDP-N-acetylmuramoyl-L-alanine--D-glutamate ligase [Gammaproteobacteria bacterium]
MTACIHDQGANGAPERILRERLGLDGISLVLGLGMTGFSCARFLHRLGLPLELADDRDAPPALERIREELSAVPVHCGELPPGVLDRCARLIASPGIAPDHPCIKAARDRGLPVMGDIELFARCARSPVAAVTGSNGKSTVTALLGEMARAAGRRVAVGGNIGVPALDLLTVPEPDLYVLELSSFQLETTDSLVPRAATILNLSADHLDRYRDLREYLQAKLRIWRGRGVAIVNRDDALSRAAAPAAEQVVSFGSDAPPDADSYGLRRENGRTWLVRGDERLLAADEMRLRGGHNALNALATLALGAAMDLPRDAMLRALRGFPGLPHRMEWVGERHGVVWYNDSKGTNVGATLAAIAGTDAPLVLIAGGLGKNQDFAPLGAALAGRARALVLIGRDADLIADAVPGSVPLVRAADMDDAVAQAAALARAGDIVLLSPACASFDMFSGYEHRGDCFVAAYRGLPS